MMNTIFFSDLSTSPAIYNLGSVKYLYHSRSLDDLHVVRIELDGRGYETIYDAIDPNQHLTGYPKNYAAGSEDAIELETMIKMIIDKHWNRQELFDASDLPGE